MIDVVGVCEMRSSLGVFFFFFFGPWVYCLFSVLGEGGLRRCGLAVLCF